MVFIALIFLFYHIYLYIENIPIKMMTNFSVKYLQFPISEASVLLSVFYVFHFAGRLLGVPISYCLKPFKMVIIDLIMISVAFFLLLLLVNFWPRIIWVSAPLAALGMSSMFATVVLWVADCIPLTGLVSAVIMVGASLGGMVGPFFVGQLFESSTPMLFVYILVAASLSHVVLFATMVMFVKRFGDRLVGQDACQTSPFVIEAEMCNSAAKGVFYEDGVTKLAVA